MRSRFIGGEFLWILLVEGHVFLMPERKGEITINEIHLKANKLKEKLDAS